MAFFVILANFNVIFKGERVEIEKVLIFFAKTISKQKVLSKSGIRFAVSLVVPKICPVEERSIFSDI